MSVYVYPGDEPTETCDKHVEVEYCVTGGGVATPYCSMDMGAEVYTRSLVRLTESEVEEIRKAGGVAEVVSYVEEVEKIIKGASA